jgi:Ribbon-helix-helix domain
VGQRPNFGTLKKAKPAPEVASASVDNPAPAASKRDARIQTSVRLEPPLWAALNDLATRKRVETQKRITVHDLLIEGARHILAVNGIKLSE